MFKQQRNEAHAGCSAWALFTSLVCGSDTMSNCDFSDELKNIQNIHRHMDKLKKNAQTAPIIILSNSKSNCEILNRVIYKIMDI